jgi:cytochrome c553
MVNNMKKILLGLIALMFLGSGVGYAESYTDSAHGNSTYGVDRTSTTQYAIGNCAHCHEQHASIGGNEPSPGSPAGPDDYLLFSDNHMSQTVNFCFGCHRGPTGGYQTGGLVNRSYSYRAGGWTSDSLDDILEAFTYGPPTSTTSSSHKLDDIKTFITGKWGYTANSNPCAACHNPHVAQGDPANLPNGAKTISSTTRGWPVTLPSKHGSLFDADILWGDGSGEKMSNYATGYTYQAPYRSGSSSAYEPDGSTTTTDGANLTDYVTFCLDCHSLALTSNTLGRSTKIIDWDATGDYHGKKNGAGGKKAPYTAATNYVLACTDCHEPHGSPNYCYLIRKEVNGGTTDFSGDTRAAWDSLCIQCHTSKLVTYCSEDSGLELCSSCHKHGSNF